MRKLSQLVRTAAVSTLATGITAAVVPWASAATAHPAAGRAGPGGQGAAAGRSVDRTGYITIAGGVKLAYDLTLPSAAGRFPVALEYNDYTAGADNGAQVPGTDAGDLLAAGFAVLGVNQPGSGCSGGVTNIADVSDWGRAGAQVVEWAARQPWSTGHVGMFGSSWTGITQLGVASFRPKGLDAITPFHVAGDLYRDVGYPGGVYNSAFINMYAAGLVRIDRQAAQAGISRGDRQCIKDFRTHVPRNQKYSIAPNMLAHPFDDRYYQAAPASRISRIDIPVLGCQSWQDGLVSSRATELYYDQFQRAASWFIGMNGPHGICDSFTQPLTMMVNFLRHYVAGGEQRLAEDPTNHHPARGQRHRPAAAGDVSLLHHPAADARRGLLRPGKREPVAVIHRARYRYRGDPQRSPPGRPAAVRASWLAGRRAAQASSRRERAGTIQHPPAVPDTHAGWLPAARPGQASVRAGRTVPVRPCVPHGVQHPDHDRLGDQHGPAHQSVGTKRPSGAVRRHRLHRPVPAVGGGARPHPRRHRQSAAAHMRQR